MFDQIGKKQMAGILITCIIILSFLSLSNVYFTEVYDSLEMKMVYTIEFLDYDDLNSILIPTGDLGRNDSQEITIILKLEEKNIGIFHKYINGTIVLPYSSTTRIIDGTGTPWINISLSSFDTIPSEKIFVEVHIHRFRTEGSYSDESVDESKWLQPTKYIDSNHSTIIAKAGDITSPSQSRKTKVSRIANFAKSVVDYNQSYAASKHWIDNDTFYGEENGRASDVLKIKKGICSHYARLCAALCRASGVPTRYVIGYLTTYDETWNSYRPVLHAWVEYFDQQMWHFIEPREGITDLYPARYVHLISGSMQEDSYYVESKYPDMYVLDNNGDDDTHVYENASYVDHTSSDIMLTWDRNLAWIYFILLVLSICTFSFFVSITLYKRWTMK